MSKSMTELFNPLSLQINLESDRPYFEVDGARTYLIDESGAISQNAVEILMHLKVEKKKYEDKFETLREYLAQTMHNGVPVQAGNRVAEAVIRNTTSNQHKEVLRQLALKVFKGDEAKTKVLVDSAVVPTTKKAIKVDGTLV